MERDWEGDGGGLQNVCFAWGAIWARADPGPNRIDIKKKTTRGTVDYRLD